MTATILAAWAIGLAPAAQPAPDAPLPRLRADLRDAAKEQVELLFEAVRRDGGASLAETARAVRRLADAEADLGDPAAAAKITEQWVEVLTAREKRLEELVRRGTASLTDYLEVKAAHADAEIELLRRQGAVKGGPRPDPARAIALHEELVRLLTEKEKLLTRAVEKGAASRADLLPVRVARLAAAVELAKLREVKADGR